ncbi:hypothetical protein PENFLA_c194G10316, partial [Penicillium flavigenum]
PASAPAPPHIRESLPRAACVYTPPPATGVYLLALAAAAFVTGGSNAV